MLREHAPDADTKSRVEADGIAVQGVAFGAADGRTETEMVGEELHLTEGAKATRAPVHRRLRAGSVGVGNDLEAIVVEVGLELRREPVGVVPRFENGPRLAQFDTARQALACDREDDVLRRSELERRLSIDDGLVSPESARVTLRRLEIDSRRCARASTDRGGIPEVTAEP